MQHGGWGHLWDSVQALPCCIAFGDEVLEGVGSKSVRKFLTGVGYSHQTQKAKQGWFKKVKNGSQQQHLKMAAKPLHKVRTTVRGSKAQLVFLSLLWLFCYLRHFYWR